MGSYVTDGAWSAGRVELGSRGRNSEAEISLNMDAVLRGDIDDPQIPIDAIFAIGYKDSADDGSGPGTILFEGCPSWEQRNVAKEGDTKSLKLQSAMTLWKTNSQSVVVGSWFPQILEPEIINGVMRLDTGVPCIFNPGGVPNRGVRILTQATISGTNIFAPPFRNWYSHYFVMPGAFDLYPLTPGPGAGSVPARYWTYAQALAYVLTFWCGANDGADVERSNVRAYFGNPVLVDQTNDLIWSAVKTYLLTEAPGETYEQTPAAPWEAPALSTHVEKLLTAKCNNLSIDGMNAIDALATILHAAGLGWWIDPTAAGANIDTLAEAVVHKFKIWTPGGEANEGGIGGQFIPRLQPYGAVTEGRTAADILATNNVKIVNATKDAQRITNRPAIVGAAAEYEVTIYLRPGWRPMFDQNIMLLDRVSTDVSQMITDPVLNQPPMIEIELARGEAAAALRNWIADPSELFGSEAPVGTLRRQRNIADMLHAKGRLGSEFYHVMRKWVCPTDHSYPTSVFTRDRAEIPSVDRDPAYWRDYSPVNWSHYKYQANGNPANPPMGLMADDLPIHFQFPQIPNHFAPGEFLPGPEVWPHRARRFLPCLCADAAGQSIGFKLEISLDRGVTWFDWSSFTVLDDELGVILNFDNPWDVRYPKQLDSATSFQKANLILAYLYHNVRVRITATIESSERRDFFPAPHASPYLDFTRAIVRRDRYRRQVVNSILRDKVTRDPAAITPLAAGLGGADPIPNAKYFLFRPVDDVAGMVEEANRIIAFQGDAKASSVLVIPWIETTALPGLYVEGVEEVGDGVPRQTSFTTDLGNGLKLSPHVAGAIFTFEAGGHRTMLTLEDWRALSELE